METRVDEIAEQIYRISTFVPQSGLVFNQFVIDAEEPLVFHTGLRALFPLVSEATATVVPIERIRWISFGHYEADECGAMNQWLAAASGAQVAHTTIGVMVSVGDTADRPARMLADGEVIDLGGKRVRHLTTPHVPHGWDAGLLYEETTGTLFAGDLFTAPGEWPATTDGDIVGPALEGEDMFGATCLTPATAPTMRRLADLEPATLALMHGPSYTGDGATALRELADAYAARFRADVDAQVGVIAP